MYKITYFTNVKHWLLVDDVIEVTTKRTVCGKVCCVYGDELSASVEYDMSTLT